MSKSKRYKRGKDASAMDRNPKFFYGYETSTYKCKDFFE
jgi:hypothetical protein